MSIPDRKGRPTTLTELGRLLLEMKSMPSDWAPSFAAVPRSAFLPDLMWPYDMDTDRTTCVARTQSSTDWQRYADSNVPIVTQWDDGQHSGADPGDVPTSSVSMPSVVFAMLGNLDVQPGHRVLEIGTGGGWNAALLAHRAGMRNVTTVEVDETVAANARESIKRTGLNIDVITGDGYLGYPPHAPFDRLIATCGLREIPYAWVEQMRPGGLLVAPWGTNYSHRDAVARLTVSDDGQRASGCFTRPVQFMKLRSQRLAWPGHDAYVPGDVAAESDRSSTTLTEKAFPDNAFDATPFAVGLRVRDCWHSVADKRSGVRPVWFYSLSDRSWAVVIFKDGRSKSPVYQAGPRRLWDEAETAYHWWQGQGAPEHHRFGLTVDRRGQRVWLDEPGNVVARPT